MTLKKLFFLFFLVFSMGKIQAQMFDNYSNLEKRTRFSFGIDLRIGVPMREFRDNTTAVGFGVAGQFLFNIGGIKSPVAFGVDMAYILYGTNTQRYNVPLPGGFLGNYEVTTNNNMFQTQFLMRLRPNTEETWFVMPYFDAVVGFNYLYTNNKLFEIQNVRNTSGGTSTQSREIQSKPLSNDFALNYGGGVGLLIGGNGALKLNLKCLFVFGTEAQYLDKSSITPDPNNPTAAVSYKVKRSTTDMLLPHIGLTFTF